jgi:hypothetical protein
MSRVNTKVEFEWDGNEYKETSSDGYDYVGEWALAIGDDPNDLIDPDNTGVDQNSPGYNSSDWEPSSSELTTLTGDQIASGFGLDPDEYGQYFSTFEGWKGGFADKQYESDVGNIIAKGESDRAEGQANLKNLSAELGSSLSENIISASTAYADTMSAQIDSQATSLMGGASTRAARTAGQRTREKSDSTSAGVSTAYGAASDKEQRALDFLGGFDEESGEYTGQMGRDIADEGIQRDYDKTAEIEQFKAETYDTLDMLGSTGAMDTEGYTASDWLNDITGKEDGHWNSSDFDFEGGDNPEFLEWFYDNYNSHDRDILAGSGSEAETAYENWEQGKPAGDNDDTCVLSTAAYRQGLITSDELMGFVNWRLRVQHKKFLGDITWLGYQIFWRPISKVMDKHLWFAKLIRNTLLKGWMGHIRCKKAYLTRFIIEAPSILTFLFRYRKAIELKNKIYGNPKAIFRAYKKLIRGN